MTSWKQEGQCFGRVCRKHCLLFLSRSTVLAPCLPCSSLNSRSPAMNRPRLPTWSALNSGTTAFWSGESIPVQVSLRPCSSVRLTARRIFDRSSVRLKKSFNSHLIRRLKRQKHSIANKRDTDAPPKAAHPCFSFANAKTTSFLAVVPIWCITIWRAILS